MKKYHLILLCLERTGNQENKVEDNKYSRNEQKQIRKVECKTVHCIRLSVDYGITMFDNPPETSLYATVLGCESKQKLLV